jgi:hypothetical protein
MGFDDNDGALLWHRRHALQIAMQLPEDQGDALLVLKETFKLVEEFLKNDSQGLRREAAPARVVALTVVGSVPPP